MIRQNLLEKLNFIYHEYLSKFHKVIIRLLAQTIPYRQFNFSFIDAIHANIDLLNSVLHVLFHTADIAYYTAFTVVDATGNIIGLISRSSDLCVVFCVGNGSFCLNHLIALLAASCEF